MRAMVLRAHGGRDAVRLETDFPDPEAGPGDVVLRVRACSLNYHDIFTRRGMPGIRIPMPAIPGLDVAGEIVAVGPEAGGSEAGGWKAGERVLVDPVNRVEGGLMGETVHGGLAELCRARAHQLVRIPDAVSFEDAAALPVAFGTALRMMHTNGQVKAGERVLILGASGGVGVCCVMLAKQAGAHVIACASTAEKLERLRALGADEVLNYVEQDFAKWVFEKYGKPHRRSYEGGVDVVVNYTGGDTWVRSLRALRRGGRLLTCGATAGFDPAEDIRYIWTFELKILGSNSWSREDIETLLRMVERKEIAVPIDGVYPLERAGEALDALEDRKVLGKLVVTP